MANTAITMLLNFQIYSEVSGLLLVNSRRIYITIYTTADGGKPAIAVYMYIDMVVRDYLFETSTERYIVPIKAQE